MNDKAKEFRKKLQKLNEGITAEQVAEEAKEALCHIEKITKEERER